MLYLASESKRRKDILKLLKIPFKSLQHNCDENKIAVNLTKPSSLVQKIAYHKAKSLLASVQSGYILSADTIGYKDGNIIMKPSNRLSAEGMLRSLRNSDHYVYTGVCILEVNKYCVKKKFIDYDKTKVTFRNFTDKELSNYLDENNFLHKAAGYGIQDSGAIFIKSITGCFYNVMGLPIDVLMNGLKVIDFNPRKLYS